MPLTPEDVQNKEFTTVRLREGYDMQEVDEFLDEVEAELARLHRDNDELREKLSAITRGGPVPVSEPAATETARAPEVSVPSGLPHEAAAKVLALAQRTADELVADSRAEAERLLADARQRAEQLDRETQAKASALEAEARERAETLNRETEQRRQELIGRLEQEREQIQRTVDGLHDFEREYRSRLRAYLEGQLQQLETAGLTETAPSSPDGNRPAASLAVEEDQPG